MNGHTLSAFVDELSKLAGSNIGSRINEAILSLPPQTLTSLGGGAMGGFSGGGPGSRVGGTLAGAATAAGTEALARKYIGQGGSLVAQMASPITGYAGGSTYGALKRNLQ